MKSSNLTNELDSSTIGFPDFDKKDIECDSISIKSEPIKSESESEDDQSPSKPNQFKAISVTSEEHNFSKRRKHRSSVDDLWSNWLFSRLDLIADEGVKLDLQRQIDEYVYDAIKQQDNL